MKNCHIIYALAQKVVDTIYDDWHHEGHIDTEQDDCFSFSVDGKMYKVTLEEFGEAVD